MGAQLLPTVIPDGVMVVAVLPPAPPPPGGGTFALTSVVALAVPPVPSVEGFAAPPVPPARPCPPASGSSSMVPTKTVLSHPRSAAKTRKGDHRVAWKILQVRVPKLLTGRSFMTASKREWEVDTIFMNRRSTFIDAGPAPCRFGPRSEERRGGKSVDVG